MEYGAHLPLLDPDGRGWDVRALTGYARAVRELGFRALAANDHLTFGAPWLDGIVALSGVVEASGDLTLATTVALPVVRGPVALAKAAAALDVLSGGRLLLGVGPGSSPADYALAGLDFTRRWPLFEESVRELRARLRGGDPERPVLLPQSPRPDGPPLWIGSWGSPAGLRRVARLGDGWLASAYNTTPQQVAAGRAAHGVRCAVATLWTWVTDVPRDRDDRLARLGGQLNRSTDELAGRVLVGSPEEGARLLRAYRDAGVETVFLWPLGDHERQLERVMRDVVPLVSGPAGGSTDG